MLGLKMTVNPLPDLFITHQSTHGSIKELVGVKAAVGGVIIRLLLGVELIFFCIFRIIWIYAHCGTMFNWLHHYIPLFFKDAFGGF